MQHYIMTILLFVVVFGVVVISHEFGHYLIARVNGIHVVEFMIGMGPKLLSFGKGDTIYSIRLFPIGGACLFEGEDGLNAAEGDPQEAKGAFPNANVWARISTVFAGPLFNFILAMLVSMIMVPMIEMRDTEATQVPEGGAAYEAGLRDGDRIVSMNGERVHLFSEIYIFIQMNKDKPIRLVYEREGKKMETVLTPRMDENSGTYLIGVVNASLLDIKGLDTVRYAWYEVRADVKNIYKSLIMLVTGQLSRRDVAGPVGMANMVGEIYEETKEDWRDVFVNMLNLILILSVNLGIINILPFPALDGGRLVFLFVEVVRGKPIPPEKEGVVHFAGMVFFLILMVVVFFNDIVNIIH